MAEKNPFRMHEQAGYITSPSSLAHPGIPFVVTRGDGNETRGGGEGGSVPLVQLQEEGPCREARTSSGVVW